MSTRGTVGFKVGDKLKVAYNHSDSYPTGLGTETLQSLNAFFDNGGTVADLRKRATKLKVIDMDKPATVAQQKKFLQYADTGVSSGQTSEWYVLLRRLQGDIFGYLGAGVIPGAGAAGDIEWSYVINLDTETFDVYDGKKLVKTIPLNKLPESFESDNI
jgi:hypothetical protein